MDDDNQSKKNKEFNKILQNGNLKDFIGFFISNYLNMKLLLVILF